MTTLLTTILIGLFLLLLRRALQKHGLKQEREGRNRRNRTYAKVLDETRAAGTNRNPWRGTR